MFEELRAHIFCLSCVKFKSDCIVPQAEVAVVEAPPPPVEIEMQHMPIRQYPTTVHI